MLTAACLVAGEPKVADELHGKKPGEMVDVIVQFTVSLTDAHHQKIRNKGGQLKKELGLVKAGLYSMPAGAVDSLASDPEVVYISPDRP